MLQKGILGAKFIAYALQVGWQVLKELLLARLHHRQFASRPLLDKNSDIQNIVIIGASFAGYYAARAIATSLPLASPYRVVVVEPHSHFHFTWVLPRFCVIDQGYKAFIPYGGLMKNVPQGRLRWVQDRVLRISRKTVELENSKEEIPFAFLVVATGSGANDGLPSRVGADAREDGLIRLGHLQRHIQDAKRLVIVGGGAAGVEIATDAKDKYPEKSVVLVHSRDSVMHRFGPELRASATRALTELGVEVILKERTTGNAPIDGWMTLMSGRKIECDYLVNCTGQRPSSDLLAALAPSTVSPSGHIRVKPTLQLEDDSLPNIYACGDVTDTNTHNPNSRGAFRQATTAASNIVRVAMGGSPSQTFRPHWADGVIKLTLGLGKSVTHVSDGIAELLFHTKEKDVALMSAQAWMHMGAKPFEDVSLLTNFTSITGPPERVT